MAFDMFACTQSMTGHKRVRFISKWESRACSWQFSVQLRVSRLLGRNSVQCKVISKTNTDIEKNTKGKKKKEKKIRGRNI